LVLFVYTGSFVDSIAVEIQHQNPNDENEIYSNIIKRGASELLKLKSAPIIDALIPNIPATFTTPNFIANIIGTPNRIGYEYLVTTVQYNYTLGGFETITISHFRPTQQSDIETLILASGEKQVLENDESINIDNILDQLVTEFYEP